MKLIFKLPNLPPHDEFCGPTPHQRFLELLMTPNVLKDVYMARSGRSLKDPFSLKMIYVFLYYTYAEMFIIF